MFYRGELGRKALWPRHEPGWGAADAAPTGGAQGGGAGAGVASGGGGSAAPTSSPYGKRFLYTGLEQVLEDPRCGKCGKDLSPQGGGGRAEGLWGGWHGEGRGPE